MALWSGRARTGLGESCRAVATPSDKEVLLSYRVAREFESIWNIPFRKAATEAGRHPLHLGRLRFDAPGEVYFGPDVQVGSRRTTARSGARGGGGRRGGHVGSDSADLVASLRAGPRSGPDSAPTAERPSYRSSSLPTPLPSPQGRGLPQETKATAKASVLVDLLSLESTGRACEAPAYARPGGDGRPDSAPDVADPRPAPGAGSAAGKRPSGATPGEAGMAGARRSTSRRRRLKAHFGKPTGATRSRNGSPQRGWSPSSRIGSMSRIRIRPSRRRRPPTHESSPQAPFCSTSRKPLSIVAGWNGSQPVGETVNGDSPRPRKGLRARARDQGARRREERSSPKRRCARGRDQRSRGKDQRSRGRDQRSRGKDQRFWAKNVGPAARTSDPGAGINDFGAKPLVPAEGTLIPRQGAAILS